MYNCRNHVGTSSSTKGDPGPLLNPPDKCVFFILFMGLTTLMAYYPDAAAVQFTKILKIQLN